MFITRVNTPSQHGVKNGRMHEIARRLHIAAREMKGAVTLTAVADLLGEKVQTVKNWESRGVSQGGQVKARELIGCDTHWLSTGEGPMRANTISGATLTSGQSGQPPASNVSAAPMGTTAIPLISRVQAGAWSEAADPYQVGDASDWLVTDLPVSKSSFALEVQGDSMLPDFHPGDRIIVDPAVQPLPGDFVVAKNGEEEATFKKYRPRGANEAGEQVFELVPLNEDYPSMRSDIVYIRIIGTMVEHRKYRRR